MAKLGKSFISTAKVGKYFHLYGESWKQNLTSEFFFKSDLYGESWKQNFTSEFFFKFDLYGEIF